MCKTSNNSDSQQMDDNCSNATQRKRVAIIGGGVSGILAIKACKEENIFHEIVCYEKTSYSGGLWRYREISDDENENISTVMFSTIANSSKEMSSFSDFPPQKWLANYMHNKSMLSYIESYAKHFDCLRHFKYQHEVVLIEKYKNTSKWRIVIKTPEQQINTESNANTSDNIAQIFDAVMICTGHHSYPNVPVFVDQHRFKGELIHTSQFKKPDKYYGKRALVIGVGNSGVDVAVELSSICEKVYLSTRRGVWILPRVGVREGRPYDFSMLRRSLHDLKDYVPLGWTQIFTETMLRKRFDHQLYGIRPSHPLFTEHPTVNDILPSKILSGTVIIKGNVCHLAENGVVFDGEDGLEYEVDVIILATGYRLSFPFLEKSLSDSIVDTVENSVKLYKYIIPIGSQSATMGFIGLPNALGPLFPIAEMQCRWFVQLVSGKFNLPSNDQMKSDIEKYRNFRLSKFTNSYRHGTQVEWIPYLDELAAMFGAKPNLFKMMLNDPSLFIKCYFGPSLPYQYRLEGPHKWSDAKRAICSANERVDAPFITSRNTCQLQIKDDVSYLKSYRDYNIFIRLFIGLFGVFFFEIFTSL